MQAPRLRVIRARRPTERERINSSLRAWRALRTSRGSLLDQYGRMIRFVREVASEAPESLAALTRLIGGSIQSMMISEILRQDGTPDSMPSSPHDFFFDFHFPLTPEGKTFDDLAPQRESPPFPRLDLQRDILLPAPWNRRRAIRALSGLRPGGAWGRWQQDQNHLVVVWFPWQIGWVYGGNHSIRSAIANGRAGKVRASAVVNVARCFEFVECDGSNWYRKQDGRVISVVASIEAGVLWEVGRLMHRTGSVKPSD